MTKELQDLAWSCLPKEFKWEVKAMYNRPSLNDLDFGYKSALLNLFGHNLTSDAEGEELLTVPRKKVEEKWQRAYEQEAIYSRAQDSPVAREELYYNRGIMSVIDTLFGSKCLPDEEPKSCGELLDKMNGIVDKILDAIEPNPAEPKFKVGDKVRYRCDGKIHEVKAKTGKYHYALSGLGHDVHEEYLEPYTEPKENIAETRNFSQDCDKHFDAILKDSFSKERRLTIAAQMMQGLICAPLIPGVDPNPSAEYLAQAAFRLADALIADRERR